MKKLVTCVVAVFAALVLMVPQVRADNNTNRNNSGMIDSTLTDNTNRNNSGVINSGTINSGTNAGGVVTNNNDVNVGNGFGNFSPVSSAIAKGGDGGNAEVKNSGNSTNLIGNATTVFGDAKSFSPEANQEQGQQQQQQQSQQMKQGQQQSSVNTNANANSNSNSNDNDVDVENEVEQEQSISIDFGEVTNNNPRQLPIGTEMNYPGMPTYMGPATNQPNYMKAETMTMFKKSFSRAEVEALLSSHGMFKRLKARNNIFTGDVPKDDRAADDSILVHLKKPEGNFAPVGYVTVYAKTPERDSVDVFFNTLEKALNTLECEEVLVVGEGAMNVLKSWGAGLGLSYTQTYISGDAGSNATGGSGTGGTGISWGEAGYRAKPWMQFILLNNLDVKTKHKVVIEKK